jgi:hypothetical protein
VADAAAVLELQLEPRRGGFRRTNAMPVFWPRDPKLKPTIDMTDSTASFSSVRRWRDTSSRTARVRSSVAPGGMRTCAYIVPWSSSGRKPLRSRVNMNASAAQMRTKAIIARARCATRARTTPW